MPPGRGTEAEKEQAWWAGYRATVLLLCAALIITVVGVVAWGVEVGWNDASDAATFFQALVTIVAVAVGGGWALYVYARSRASASFVKVHLEKTGYAERRTGEAVLRYAVVGVTVENTGRRPLETALVQIEARYLDLEKAAFGTRLSGARVVDPSKERPVEVLTRNLSLRDDIALRFEPGQRVSEEVLISLGRYHAAAVEARYVGYALRWRPQKEIPQLGQERWRSRRIHSARIMLDPEALMERIAADE